MPADLPSRFDPDGEAAAARGRGRRWRRLVARVLYGRRARAAVEAARRDLAGLPIAEVVARRTGAPAAARPSRGRLRALNLAVFDRIWRDRDPQVCLLRCVALLADARRLGFRPSLVIGVARATPDALAGHAWLEEDGRALLEPGGVPTRFTVVARLPAVAPPVPPGP